MDAPREIFVVMNDSRFVEGCFFSNAAAEKILAGIAAERKRMCMSVDNLSVHRYVLADDTQEREGK
jgi:hypothetical protein